MLITPDHKMFVSLESSNKFEGGQLSDFETLQLRINAQGCDESTSPWLMCGARTQPLVLTGAALER
jgi:hypothetical protein